VTAALVLAAVVGARVFLVQPAGASARSVETFNRIRGEISASGLEARLLVASGDPGEAAARAARGPDAVAALTIVWAGRKHAEIRVLTARPATELTRRVRLRHHHRREVAILAVELLHAALSRPPPAGPTLLDISRSAAEPRRGPEPAGPPPPESGPHDAAGPVITVGGALLDAPDPVGPVFVPTVALSYGWRPGPRPWLGLVRLGAAGLGTQVVLERPATRVSVRRVLAALELLALYQSGMGLHPFLGLGAGACAYSSSAEDPADLRGPAGTRAAFLATADAGVFWPIWGRLGIWVEGRALVPAPSPTLGTKVVDVPLLGRPSVMLSLSLGAALSGNGQ
jgi:hypothetical protein